MGEIRERIENEMKGLRTIRDDLRVRLHLGQREVRDQWEKLERTWQHVEAKTKVLREESKESMEDVEEAARLLVDEIREGYRNLKRLV
jgi:adenylate cyclase